MGAYVCSYFPQDPNCWTFSNFQVNTSGEVNKNGVEPGELNEIVRKYSCCLFAGRNTVTIWIPDLSDIQMVDLCQFVKWSGIRMVVWKLDWKKPVNGPNVRYSNGLPMHTTLPFDYQTLTLTRKMDDALIFHCSLHNIICKSFRLVLMCDVNLGIWANSSG